MRSRRHSGPDLASRRWHPAWTPPSISCRSTAGARSHGRSATRGQEEPAHVRCATMQTAQRCDRIGGFDSVVRSILPFLRRVPRDPSRRRVSTPAHIPLNSPLSRRCRFPPAAPIPFREWIADPSMGNYPEETVGQVAHANLPHSTEFRHGDDVLEVRCAPFAWQETRFPRSRGQCCSVATRGRAHVRKQRRRSQEERDAVVSRAARARAVARARAL